MINWLDSLKPGDNVILNSGFNDKRVVSVKRITKTQIIIERISLYGNGVYEQKFSRKCGYMICGSGGKPFITEATPEIIAEIKINNERKRIINKIYDFDFKKLNLESLYKIEDILKQVENE